MIQKKHAVMMEYVIIAVLVAAAVVVAVIMFGKTVSQEMNVATEAMVAPGKAQTRQEGLRSDLSKKTEKAEKNTNKIHGGEF